jgi:translation initiation factor IF-2
MPLALSRRPTTRSTRRWRPPRTPPSAAACRSGRPPWTRPGPGSPCSRPSTRTCSSSVRRLGPGPAAAPAEAMLIRSCPGPWAVGPASPQHVATQPARPLRSRSSTSLRRVVRRAHLQWSVPGGGAGGGRRGGAPGGGAGGGRRGGAPGEWAPGPPLRRRPSPSCPGTTPRRKAPPRRRRARHGWQRRRGRRHRRRRVQGRRCR